MFFTTLKNIFQSENHKDIMLTGLYLSSIIIFIVIGVVALFMGYKTIFWTKLGISVVITILLYTYLRFYQTQLYAGLLILIVEIDSAFIMMNEYFNTFITIYPFFIIFGFFFFFKLKTAIWMTLVHFLYWLTVVLYGSHFFPDHPIFQTISIMSMLLSSIVAIVFALFYHISTELTYEELKHTNRQKEILLKEIHHRIKNNLNKISSMIGLQILSIEDGKEEEAEEVLKKGQLRIEAMAMVYDTLYKSNNLEKIHFEKYIKNLTNLINKSYDKLIPVEVYSENIILPLDVMMKIGIVINELMINSIKHAKPKKLDYYMIFIDLNSNGENCLLKYRQHGDNFIDLYPLENTNNLGMKLIKLTIKEMGGEIKISNNHGLTFTISFPCKTSTMQQI